MARPIRTLLFSTLYPSSARPVHGIFVETRLRELLSTGAVETKVLAPVPWFPSTHARWGEYARMSATPAREVRNGIDVLHPRYVVLPKVGMSLAPLLLAAASIGPLRRLMREGWDFDVLDAHYFYPDGVAAVLLARWVNKPLTITARGTDLNLIPQHALPRRMIHWAARRADASIGVCSALVDVLREWNIEPSRLHVMRNGVDLRRFHPVPQAQARQQIGLDGSPLLLSVGHLIERKGHHLVIDALQVLSATHPGARLAIVGAGEERERLERRAYDRGVQDRVTFAGALPNNELATWYSAADALVLASSREGWANVLLEAMACGTPVVASDIWGTPEVVAPESGGKLVASMDGSAFARAISELLSSPPDCGDVRRYAERFGWEPTSQSQLTLFRSIAVQHSQVAEHA